MSSIGRFLRRVLGAIRARWSSRGLELGPSPVETWWRTKLYRPPESSWAQRMERLVTAQLSDPEGGFIEIVRETDIQSGQDNEDILDWPGDDVYFFKPEGED